MHEGHPFYRGGASYAAQLLATQLQRAVPEHLRIGVSHGGTPFDGLSRPVKTI